MRFMVWRLANNLPADAMLLWPNRKQTAGSRPTQKQASAINHSTAWRLYPHLQSVPGKGFKTTPLPQLRQSASRAADSTSNSPFVASSTAQLDQVASSSPAADLEAAAAANAAAIAVIFASRSAAAAARADAADLHTTSSQSLYSFAAEAVGTLNPDRLLDAASVAATHATEAVDRLTAAMARIGCSAGGSCGAGDYQSAAAAAVLILQLVMLSAEVGVDDHITAQMRAAQLYVLACARLCGT